MYAKYICKIGTGAHRMVSACSFDNDDQYKTITVRLRYRPYTIRQNAAYLLTVICLALQYGTADTASWLLRRFWLHPDLLKLQHIP